MASSTEKDLEILDRMIEKAAYNDGFKKGRASMVDDILYILDNRDDNCSEVIPRFILKRILTNLRLKEQTNE